MRSSENPTAKFIGSAAALGVVFLGTQTCVATTKQTEEVCVSKKWTETDVTDYDFERNDGRTATGTATDHHRYVADVRGKVFEVSDSWFALSFQSKKNFASMKEGRKYEVEVYGLFSGENDLGHPQILEITQDLGECVRDVVQD